MKTMKHKNLFQIVYGTVFHFGINMFVLYPVYISVIALIGLCRRENSNQPSVLLIKEGKSLLIIILEIGHLIFI